MSFMYLEDISSHTDACSYYVLLRKSLDNILKINKTHAVLFSFVVVLLT